MSAKPDRHPLFMPLILVGGLIFGFGLGYSHMARPEVVLNFLQFEDFGLIFVMGGAAVVTGVVFAVATGVLDSAPLTGRPYTRRLKSFDRNVLIGGSIFGVGNYPILFALAGMFLGAYAQGYYRSRTTDDSPTAQSAD